MITAKDIRAWFRDTERLTVRIQRDGDVIATHAGRECVVAQAREFVHHAGTLQLSDRTNLDSFRRWQDRTVGLFPMARFGIQHHYQAQLQQANVQGKVSINPVGEVRVHVQCQDPEFKGYVFEHYIDAQSNVHLIK